MRIDVTVRGNWERVSVCDGIRWRFFYYWHRLRVPWLAWVIFS